MSPRQIYKYDNMIMDEFTTLCQEIGRESKQWIKIFKKR